MRNSVQVMWGEQPFFQKKLQFNRSTKNKHQSIFLPNKTSVFTDGAISTMFDLVNKMKETFYRMKRYRLHLVPTSQTQIQVKETGRCKNPLSLRREHEWPCLSFEMIYFINIITAQSTWFWLRCSIVARLARSTHRAILYLKLFSY